MDDTAILLSAHCLLLAAHAEHVVTANTQQQTILAAVERAADTRAIVSGPGALATAGE
jgi:hypothetical protein